MWWICFVWAASVGVIAIIACVVGFQHIGRVRRMAQGAKRRAARSYTAHVQGLEEGVGCELGADVLEVRYRRGLRGEREGSGSEQGAPLRSSEEAEKGEEGKWGLSRLDHGNGDDDENAPLLEAAAASRPRMRMT